MTDAKAHPDNYVADRNDVHRKPHFDHFTAPLQQEFMNSPAIDNYYSPPLNYYQSNFPPPNVTENAGPPFAPSYEEFRNIEYGNPSINKGPYHSHRGGNRGGRGRQDQRGRGGGKSRGST